MLRCHAVAYHSIKRIRSQAQVGMAKHYRVIEAWPGTNRLHQWWARRVSWFFNDLWMECLTSGRRRWPLGRGSINGLAGTFDFTAINYYSRSLVRFPPRPGRLYESEAPPGAVMADDDFFELYPQGLFKAIQANVPFGKPIIVAENGLPDASDKLRSEFILTHLREVWRAISFNYPVMGYYHWTLVDNFEWDRGWRQRFGLIELDVETQKRTWRPSGRLYAEICRSNSISSDMAERYAPGVLETMFPGKSPNESRQSATQTLESA
jgi:beta-glucosidase